MERWEIRPAPNEDDPHRHLLLMRGGVADVAAVLKKFGALCGRPTPIDGEEFNLSFVLHQVTPELREKLDQWLSKMAPPPPEEPPMLPPLAKPVSLPALHPSFPAAKEPLISLGPEAVMRPPVPALQLAPAPASLEASTTSAAGAVAPANELISEWTFETLQVGAHNRFAHAAAMSVVASPGSMYNPLFLYGAPGTGKSHLLYSIAHSMSKGLGAASLLVTSGARLSRAASAAVADGSTEALDAKAAQSKALFVDDIHLLAITDRNKSQLAKMFKSFFDRGQQVVITSIYPPKALGAIEESLQFTFSKGWSVDLKIPSQKIQRDIVAAVTDRFGAQLSGDEIGVLADKLMQWGYPDLALWAQRIAVWRRMRAAADKPAPLTDLLRLTYDQIALVGDAPPVSTAGAVFRPAPAAAGARPLAIIVPAGQEGLGAYVARLFHETGERNGFTRAYGHALMGAYDSMQQVGVPFQIADMCHRSAAAYALIVGPGPDSPLALRAGEFGHAVRRILDGSGVVAAWIPHMQLHLGAHYLNAHLDFEK